jgi:hypothetical protein
LKISDFYELTRQVWRDGDEWYYSIIQRFSSDDDDVEPLAYGTAEDEEDAMRLAGLSDRRNEL